MLCVEVNTKSWFRIFYLDPLKQPFFNEIIYNLHILL